MSAIALLIEITLAVNALICFREVESDQRGAVGVGVVPTAHWAGGAIGRAAAEYPRRLGYF